jgi:hypothetical protein
MEKPISTPLDSLVHSLPEAGTLVWLVFLVILLYTALHAGIFVYHWHKFNIAPPKFIKITYVVYFAGIGVFLLGLFLSTIAITS